MADTDSMFSAYGSIFDAATADNVGVRDRALSVAQLQPGRATVYGAHQAGGMLMQNLAGMAGMKTAEQQKAETITSIMKESQGLDPNDPQSARLLAQKFIQAGLPGIGQKFLERARTIDVKNQELALTGRQVTAEEERVDILGAKEVREGSEFRAELEIKKSYLEMDWGKFEHAKFQDKAYLDIATNKQTQDKAMDDFEIANSKILNALRSKEIDITEANSKLQANMFAFDQLRAKVGDEQWAAEFSETKLNNAAARELKLAQKDDIIIQTEAYTENNNIRNERIKVETEAIKVQKALDERGVGFPETGEYMFQRDEDGAEHLLKYNLEKVMPDGSIGGYEEVTGEDGVALGFEGLDAQEYGLTAAEGRLYDKIWDQYKQRYYTGSGMYGEGQWDEEYPDFVKWAEDNVGGPGLAVVIKGSGGDRDRSQKLIVDTHNTSEDNNGETVAVSVANIDAEAGTAQDDIKVFTVNYDKISSGENISVNTLKKVPAEIDGKANTLTNGQYLTKLIQEGRADEAQVYIDSLPVARSTTADTKDDVSTLQAETKWEQVRVTGAGPTKTQLATGDYKLINNKWHKRISIKKDK